MARRRPALAVDRTARRRAVLAGCVLTALTAVSCAALLAAAILVPAPLAVMPLVVPVGVGVPMFAAWELSRRMAGLPGADDAPDADASEARAIADLRSALAQLPETRHPLGL